MRSRIEQSSGKGDDNPREPERFSLNAEPSVALHGTGEFAELGYLGIRELEPGELQNLGIPPTKWLVRFFADAEVSIDT